MALWTIWLAAVVGSFALFEGLALYRNKPTLSRFVWTLSAKFPPFGWIAGVLTGFLAAHFWWGGIVCFAPVQ